MRRRRWFAYLLIATVAAFVAGIASRQIRIDELRKRIASSRVPPHPPRAAQVESQAAQAEMIARLRREIAGLEKTTAQIQRELSDLDRRVPATGWTNAGRASPGALLETMLWASLRGDADTLTQSLALTPLLTAKAQWHFRRLPETAKARFGTPETLIAVFAAAEIPTDRVTVNVANVTSNRTQARLEFHRDNQAHVTTLNLERRPDGWRVAVPEHAIDRFFASARDTE